MNPRCNPDLSGHHHMESQTPKLYSTTLLDSLKDVTDKCFIFRAYKSPDGSVENATGFLPGPLLQSHGLMKAIQEVLQMARGFSVEQSQAYTLHSPRHFLPEVSAARGEPGTCRCEIGRWSHSVAQLPAFRPETNMLRKHTAMVSTLLDLYAKNNATQRPLMILRRQMESLWDFAVTCGPGKFPMHGGLQNLSKLKATGGLHED